MKCEECKKREATYIWFDRDPDRLVLICDVCYHKLVHMFGEDGFDSYDMTDPYFLFFLIRRVNARFKWHEAMRKRVMESARSVGASREEFGGSSENKCLPSRYGSETGPRRVSEAKPTSNSFGNSREPSGEPTTIETQNLIHKRRSERLDVTKGVSRKERIDKINVVEEIKAMRKKNDYLAPEEIADVEEAWAEIERGEAKRGKNVEELLKDLKAEG